MLGTNSNKLATNLPTIPIQTNYCAPCYKFLPNPAQSSITSSSLKNKSNNTRHSAGWLAKLAVLVGLGELALDLLEDDGRRPGRRELQLERARRGQLALGEVGLVPDLAGERHLHLEQPRGVLLPELGDAGVPERHVRGARAGVEVVHPCLAGRVDVPLAGELDAVEPLAVEAVVGLQRLGVLDAHGPVPVADGEREGEVVGERGGRGRHEGEPGQRGGLDGDLHVADEAVGGQEHDEEDDGGEHEEADAEAEDGLPRVVRDAGAAPVAERVVAAAAAVVEAAHGGGGANLALRWRWREKRRDPPRNGDGELEIWWVISVLP